MEIKKLLVIMDKYNSCPKCGNGMIGNGQGKLIIEDDFYYRSCKCGWSIKLDEDGKEIKDRKGII